MSNARRMLLVAAAGVVALALLVVAFFQRGQPSAPRAEPAAEPAGSLPDQPMAVRPAPIDAGSWTQVKVDGPEWYGPAIVGHNQLLPQNSPEARYATAGAVGPHGELVLGTETEGIYMWDPKAHHWSHVGEDEGLAEDAVYALAVDHAGRIWVGHRAAGVSVWNGAAWQTYGPGFGPLDGHISAIATGPDDSVWLATSAGLTRYDERRGTWRHYTLVDGLPGLQAARLAFAPDGTLYVAMLADGLAVASPADDYAHFRTILAEPPERVSARAGAGLPSNLCNDVVVTREGHIYVATCYGLARSMDGGKTFYYFRGGGDPTADEPEEKPAAAARPAGGQNWPCQGQGVLLEDFVRVLATDAAGRVYAGYREHRGEIFAPAGRDPQAAPQVLGTFEGEAPTSLTVVPGGYLLMTQTKAGSALARVADLEAPALRVRQGPAAALPVPAGVPSLEELRGLLQTARAVGVAEPGPVVVPLEDDWATQGAFLGRHGKYFAALAATISPSDYVWGVGADTVSYHVTAGEGALRYYIHSNHTSDPGALELPMPYLDTRVQQKLTTWEVDRREAEWNDFGGGMVRPENGPHVYLSVQVPAGLYIWSIYFHNKDGHGGQNSLRDYGLSVRPQGRSAYDLAGFASRPELARGRVRQFWHGVYKQFLIQGPTTLQVQVDRNRLALAIIAGMMLDEVEERSSGYFVTREERAKRVAADEKLRRELAGTLAEEPLPATATATAGALLAALDTARVINPRWWGQERRRYYDALLRFYRVSADPAGRRKHATCCYYLQLFEAWEKDLAAAEEPSPRVVERALRWNGNENTYARENYDLVRRYLTGGGTGPTTRP